MNGLRREDWQDYMEIEADGVFPKAQAIIDYDEEMVREAEIAEIEDDLMSSWPDEEESVVNDIDGKEHWYWNKSLNEEMANIHG